MRLNYALAGFAWISAVLLSPISGSEALAHSPVSPIGTTTHVSQFPQLSTLPSPGTLSLLIGGSRFAEWASQAEATSGTWQARFRGERSAFSASRPEAPLWLVSLRATRFLTLVAAAAAVGTSFYYEEQLEDRYETYKSMGLESDRDAFDMAWGDIEDTNSRVREWRQVSAWSLAAGILLVVVERMVAE